VTCPSCKATLPERALVCEYCLDSKSRKAYLQHQLQSVPKVLSEEISLIVCDPGHGKAHLAMFGLPMRSFCWQKLPQVERKRWALRYSDLDKKVTCRDCKAAWNGLVNALREAKAVS